jgi:hypothetical protein
MPNYNPETDDYKQCPQQNMATLVSSSMEQDLKKQVLGRSEAEKVFRPWWDTIEDYLLNALVLLGEYYVHIHNILLKIKYLKHKYSKDYKLSTIHPHIVCNELELNLFCELLLCNFDRQMSALAFHFKYYHHKLLSTDDMRIIEN